MSSNQPVDLLIRGGTVIDGTGAPGQVADVAIRDDRIVAVGRIDHADADRVVDATGRVVAPGFIDVHTHDDRALLSNPTMAMKVSQGVTTVVAGNCGISLAPLIASAPPPPLDLIGAPGAFRYRTVDDYLGELEAGPAAVNGAFLVGHSTLRVGTMDSLERAATGREVAAMRRLLEDGLQAGAVGLSTGLFYRPAFHAPTSEVIELSAALKAHGARYVTHMRDEGDYVLRSLEETFEIGTAAESPVVISHHKVHGRHNFGRSHETLACIDAHAAHHDCTGVAFDVYPYVASSTVLKEDSIVVAERVLITWSRARPDLAGRDLADIAREFGCDLLAAAERLQPAGAIYFAMHEDDVRRILSHPGAMIGSDGLPHDEHPHPRLWGTFPRVLGHYCRDVGLFSLEEAVRRMTGYPAATFGLVDRGTVRPGAFADLTVFNPDTVLDRATFEHPATPAAGIETVLVNGRTVWQDGAVTGNRPGRVLRHGGA